jgi:flagellar hook protein FlgE
MPTTSAMFTGLSGLSVNARRLELIGNNIANVNTTAFKSNRMLFAPMFNRNFSLGTAPNNTTGGTNPGQVGLGVKIAGTQRNFNNGAIGATGVMTDLAVEGDGFFIVEKGAERFYSRSGAFQLNANNDLVTIGGGRVMGYAVDAGNNIVHGQLVNLNIPLGTQTLAEATGKVIFNGNLNAAGEVGISGSVHTARAFYLNANVPPDTPMTGNEDITAGQDIWVFDSTGVPTLAIEGGAETVFTISGIEKGGKDIGTHTFAFSADPNAADVIGNTMNDFIAFLENILGLDDSLGGGIEINADGQIVITGNTGSEQDIDIAAANIVASGGAGKSQPFSFTKDNSADGESVRTSFTVYDSLGTPITIDLTFVLHETLNGEGTVWRFIAESNDNDAVNRVVGLGEVRFDSNGKMISATNQQIEIARDNGAINPLTIQLDMDTDADAISALSGQTSQLAAVSQDGAPLGVLSNFSIGENGKIFGAFTNGLIRTIGQIAMANFANPEGLVDTGNNLFQVGPNSGNPLITTPGEFGTGRVIGGALELSNVDLSQEFIDMILASTGYSASSRVITTTNELIQQLLVLGR